MAKVGRPLYWETLEEFNDAAKGFFDWCKKKNYIPDIEGLAVYLKCNRETIREYEKKEEFSGTIKNIKNKIAFEKKQLALTGDIPAAVFCFDFKNNHGYKDKQEVETTFEVKTPYDRLAILAEKEGLSIEELAIREGIDIEEYKGED